MRRAVTWKVWLCVEPLDLKGDSTGEDVDLPFGAEAEFASEAEAVSWAITAHRRLIGNKAGLPLRDGSKEES